MSCVFVTDIAQSQIVAQQLMEEDYIAVNAEGINLGRYGRMTLLTVCKKDGSVFIFDIYQNKDLIIKGNLKEVLESPEVTKLMYSCKNDVEALRFQFGGIQMQNVFDMQVADLSMQEREKLFPTKESFIDACTKYSVKNMDLELVNSVKREYLKVDGKYWARSELKPETKNYVMICIQAYSQLFEELQRRSDSDSNSREEFILMVKKRTDEVIYPRCRSINNERTQERRNLVRQQVMGMPERYPNDIQFEDLDEDDKMAVKLLSSKTRSIPQMVKRLQKGYTESHIDELIQEIEREGNDFLPRVRSFGYVATYRGDADANLRAKASDFIGKVNKIVINDIRRKYDDKTPAKYLAEHEQNAIRALRPEGETDDGIDDTILLFYWKLKEIDLYNSVDMLERRRSRFRMKLGWYKWVVFCSRKGPDHLKGVAKMHLQSLDQIFGRDNLPLISEAF